MCDTDCSKIPIEALKPCEPIFTGASTEPSADCCRGVNIWDNANPRFSSDVCNCYKASPGRLPFKIVGDKAKYLTNVVLLLILPISFRQCMRSPEVSAWKFEVAGLNKKPD
ncbi:hypothetical protein CASFOL_003889 [Castilleja foliolosa]|uniref:Uncharacterized protein n=1 Tax=Castilleja foliolosa TaxID=1961234 RepID=A0ABD3EIG5_9LAMI